MNTCLCFPVLSLLALSEDDSTPLSHMFLFLIVIKFLLGLAASLVADQTNVGVAVFVADTTSMTGRVGPVGWGCCPPSCVLACPLLQSSVWLPLS